MAGFLPPTARREASSVLPGLTLTWGSVQYGGRLRAHGVNFVVLATGAAVILALLNFLPALSLGTIADGLL
ncbi:potassium-transporting ATPase subunit KdpA [Streptomyces sp. NPDC002012]|uniref:potassium-transporting ATPase subunit KdpA n=1 Tax=Streptomyces sp. NPDC002012 TaxID=3154532 RepID=UPI00332A30D3